jgi:hypothetical protein
MHPVPFGAGDFPVVLPLLWWEGFTQQTASQAALARYPYSLTAPQADAFAHGNSFLCVSQRDTVAENCRDSACQACLRMPCVIDWENAGEWVSESK